MAIEAPTRNGSFYEMRRYQAVVGKTASLEQQVRNRPHRSGDVRVGLWTGIAPDPNEVFELLAYPDLGSRPDQESRQTQQEWLESIAATMRGAASAMLIPVDISPLR
jgi:hypothetical protein